MENSSTKIKCLVLSDIHQNYNCLKRLKTHLDEQKIELNYIIATGDFVSLKPKEKIDPKYIKEAEKEIKEMIRLLEDICPTVIYIGGNHEPITLFTSPPPSMSSKSTNLHKGFVTFDSNLYVASVAGAVHAVDASSDFKKIVWNGFPYFLPTYFQSDAKYSKDLHDLFDMIDKDIKTKKPINPKILLLTHNGPYGVKTTFSNEDGIYVQSGSIGLMKLIEERDDILINLHGHTHKGYGQDKINSTLIFNTGATKYNRFTVMDLEKNEETGWEIKAIETKTV